jgi:putative membrane protein
MRRYLRPLFIACVASALGSLPALADDSDQEFVAEIAQGSMAEVELGKLAGEKASDAKVRDFAQKMEADHKRANEELKAAASRAGLSVPEEIGAEHQATIDRLTQLSGAEFDEAYIAEMVKKHEKTVEELREQAANPQTDIDRWAANTLPTIESHLRHARSLEQQLASDASSTPAVSAGPPGESD